MKMARSSTMDTPAVVLPLQLQQTHQWKQEPASTTSLDYQDPVGSSTSQMTALLNSPLVGGPTGSQQPQTQSQQAQDVISMHYMELEEFLLENAVAVAQQQQQQQEQPPKVYMDPPPTSMNSQLHHHQQQQQQQQQQQVAALADTPAAKSYQVHLEPRSGPQPNHLFNNNNPHQQQPQPHHQQPQPTGSSQSRSSTSPDSEVVLSSEAQMSPVASHCDVVTGAAAVIAEQWGHHHQHQHQHHPHHLRSNSLSEGSVVLPPSPPCSVSAQGSSSSSIASRTRRVSLPSQVADSLQVSVDSSSGGGGGGNAVAGANGLVLPPTSPACSHSSSLSSSASLSPHHPSSSSSSCNAAGGRVPMVAKRSSAMADMSPINHAGAPNKKAARRSKKESVPEENKDEKYWKRRAKNNEAAKRSRDLRREKETQILKRVQVLERENQLLHSQLQNLSDENADLKERLARYEQV